MQDNTFLKITYNKVNIFYKTQLIKDLQAQKLYKQLCPLFYTIYFVKTDVLIKKTIEINFIQNLLCCPTGKAFEG